VDVGAPLRVGLLERWTVAARKAGTHSLLIWPPLVLAFVAYVSVRAHALSFDLAHAYISGAHAVLDGRSPFPPPVAGRLTSGAAYIYPPVTAWLAVPFTVLPLSVAEAVGFVLSLAAILATFLVLGVRDWRCLMITLLWVPTYSAIQTANMTLLLLLGIALLWRYRTRTAVSGIVLGILVAIKLYVWPLAFWLVAMRRYPAAAISGLTAAILIVGSWAPIGFAGFRGYPHLLSMLTQLERGNSYTLSAVLVPTLSWPLANTVTTALGVALVALSWRVAHLGDERAGFVYAIAAMLVLTPIVHMNYFIILIVVIALYQPAFGPLWALPLLLWVGPQVSGSNGQPWQTWTVLVLVACTIVLAARPGRPPLLEQRRPASANALP
jgi:Glycosyltransferase family 87